MLALWGAVYRTPWPPCMRLKCKWCCCTYGVQVANFGKSCPLGRAAQPCEIAPAYVFLASEVGSQPASQPLT